MAKKTRLEWAEIRNRQDMAIEWAAEVLEVLQMTTAPIDPLAVAAAEKPLLSPVGADFRNRFDGQLEYHRSRNRFLLFYNTKYDNYFQDGRHHPRTRFSIAHELGHYFIEAHRAFLRQTGKSHRSRGEFLSDRLIETDADAFAAGLLMPSNLLGPMVNEGDLTFAQIEEWAEAFGTSLTSTARRSIELSDFPCALVGVRDGRVAFSFLSQAMVEGGCYPRPRGSDLPSETQSKWQAFARESQSDDTGQAFANAWFQTYGNDRTADAPVREHYRGVPSMQTLLVLLTIQEEELFPDEDG